VVLVVYVGVEGSDEAQAAVQEAAQQVLAIGSVLRMRTESALGHSRYTSSTHTRKSIHVHDEYEHNHSVHGTYILFYAIKSHLSLFQSSLYLSIIHHIHLHQSHIYNQSSNYRKH
jgi:hypothetical protein